MPDQTMTERVMSETIEYRPSYLSPEDPSIEIESYVTSPDFFDPDATPIVVFLGYGEGSDAAKEATKIMSEMTGRPVIAPVLNLENSKNPDELKESAVGMALTVIEHINDALRLVVQLPVWL